MARALWLFPPTPAPTHDMRFDFSSAWATIQGLGEDFVGAIPRLILAIIVIVTFTMMARMARRLARRIAMRRGEQRTLQLAVGRLAQAGIILLGILVGVTAAFPSFTPANLVSTLGIGGVAIGFAFKDIFQNFVAGLLILITRPFVVGDQIRFKDYEGTVDDIQTRATFVKTYDGRRIIIPNGELYTNSVTVNTAFAERRWEYDVCIGYGDDVEEARAIMLQVLRDVDIVSADPKADVILVKLADSTVNLRARWWTKSRMADGLVAQDRVLTAMKRALTQAGIDLPFPTQQILFHDQTEVTDGNRRRQREGWPVGSQEVPQSRWDAERSAGTRRDDDAARQTPSRAP